MEIVGRFPYIALTTYRRSGSPVSTPVWVAASGTKLWVITVDGVGKTKRLAHTAEVRIQPCDVRGRVSADAPSFTGTARVLRDDESLRIVRQALAAKYRSARISEWLARFGGRRRRRRAAIVITLQD